PTVIAACAWLSGRPYPELRTLFYWLEWGALLASIGLLALTLPTAAQRLAFTGVALLFFAGGSSLRVHVERGQVYVFLLLAASVAALVVARGGAPEWAGIA